MLRVRVDKWNTHSRCNALANHKQYNNWGFMHTHTGKVGSTQDLVVGTSVFNRKPMQLPTDRNIGNDVWVVLVLVTTQATVLHALKFSHVICRQTLEQRIAIIKSASNKGISSCDPVC